MMTPDGQHRQVPTKAQAKSIEDVIVAGLQGPL